METNHERPVRSRKPNPKYVGSPFVNDINHINNTISRLERDISMASISASKPLVKHATDMPHRRVSYKPDLKSLSKFRDVRAKADEVVHQLWSDSESEAEQDVRPVASDSKGKSLIKSGIFATTNDNVMVRVAWPHSQLQYQFVTKPYNFYDLTFPLLVAGGLEIINSDIRKEEMLQV